MEKDRICGVYKITSPSGRIYIGQAVNIKKRWSDYRQMNSKTENQVRLWRSFKKYEAIAHVFEIIEECSIEDLNCRERYWQDFYDVLNGGLNCVLQECGEQRRIFSQETLNKRRQNTAPRIISLEEREATRIRMLGNTFNTGRIREKSEKDQISATMKLKGVQSKEKNSMWGKFGADNPNSKIILDLQTGIFYFGIKEASVAKNIPYSSLKKMMSNGKPNITSLIYV